MPSHREPVTAVGAPAAVGPYSHAIKAAGLLFCSGQIPLHPESGEIVGDSFAEQTQRCLENLQAVCTAAGTRLEEAVSVRVFVTDLGAFAEVNEAYERFFSAAGDPPARTAVEVSALPKGAKVEVDAVVALTG